MKKLHGSADSEAFPGRRGEFCSKRSLKCYLELPTTNYGWTHGKAEGLFYFTNYDLLSVETILQSPIWRRADRDDFVPLMFVD